MDRLRALAVHPFAVDGIEGPGAVEGQAAGGADAGFGDGNGIEGFNGVETDIDEARGDLRRGHGESLTEERGEAGVTTIGETLRSCHGPSAPARRRRGPPVGMTVVRVHRWLLPDKLQGFSAQKRKLSFRTQKKEGRSAILSLSSAAAPLGDGSIAERSYRGGISDVDPHPARLNLRAQCGALRSLWLNPALCDSPIYRRGAKSGKKEMPAN